MLILLVVLALVVSFGTASFLGRLLHQQTTYPCALCDVDCAFSDPISVCEACRVELSEGREHACFHCQQDSEDCRCE